MIVEKLLRLMERQAQRRPNLPGCQFSFGEALQNECFQQLTRMRLFVQVELLGELVGNMDSDDHAELRNHSPGRNRSSRQESGLNTDRRPMVRRECPWAGGIRTFSLAINLHNEAEFRSERLVHSSTWGGANGLCAARRGQLDDSSA